MFVYLLLLIIFVVLFSWCLTTLDKKFPVFKTIFRRLWAILKWLYKDRREYSGAGKIKEPRARYYDN